MFVSDALILNRKPWPFSIQQEGTETEPYVTMVREGFGNRSFYRIAPQPFMRVRLEDESGTYGPDGRYYLEEHKGRVIDIYI